MTEKSPTPRQGTCSWEAPTGSPPEGQGLLGQRGELRDGQGLSPSPHWPPTAEPSGRWVQGKPSPPTALARDRLPQTTPDTWEPSPRPGRSTLVLPVPAATRRQHPGPLPTSPASRAAALRLPYCLGHRVACRPLPLPWPRSLSTSHGTTSFHRWNRVPRSSMIHTPGWPLLPRLHGPHCPTAWPSQPFRILEGAGIIAGIF